ncbi:MAG: single-stranded DNA-binding protein [Bacteroidaceae bacterium]|nr:single-stranded DNA-binding protein [Bacteroidaceae bacterium]
MNKVILIGNVGQDPNVRYVDNGTCVAQFRLATTERGYTLQNGTQVPDRTEWHNLVFWKGIAERVERYVRKGMKISVEGKLRTRTFETRDNQQRQVTEVVVENMEILSPIHRDAPAHTDVEEPAEQPAQAAYSQPSDVAPF